MHTPINFSLESIQHFIKENFRRTFEVEVPVQVTQHQTIIKICEQREKSANKLHPHEAKAALAIAVKAARESKKEKAILALRVDFYLLTGICSCNWTVEGNMSKQFLALNWPKTSSKSPIFCYFAGY